MEIPLTTSKKLINRWPSLTPKITHSSHTELEVPAIQPDLHEGTRGGTVWKSALNESNGKKFSVVILKPALYCQTDL